MAEEKRPPGEAPAKGGDGGGSYTARPSNEPPAEGTTRDEDQEAKERTGSEDEEDPPGSAHR